MNLQDAVVTGFFSLPSASLAEHNPDAYNNAMRGVPVGAGTCAHCGTGIIHHVVVSIEGKTHFIGTECARKIGGDIARCVVSKVTASQLAARAEANERQRLEWNIRQEEIEDRRRARKEHFSFTLQALRDTGNQFHESLADQLELGPISSRQADFVCKSVYGRQNKGNREAWEALHEDAETWGLLVEYQTVSRQEMSTN